MSGMGLLSRVWWSGCPPPDFDQVLVTYGGRVTGDFKIGFRRMLACYGLFEWVVNQEIFEMSVIN